MNLLAALEVPFDALVTLDWETYYDHDYSLTKLTTADYVRDPRFETTLVGVKVNDAPARWMEEIEFANWASTVDWSRTAVLAHHAHFDLLILAHHYGASPAFIFDTLSMARAIHGTEVGGSLAKLSLKYGIGEKGHEVLNAKGKRRKDFTDEEIARYGAYCVNDVDLTHTLFERMSAGFPEFELHLIDTTVRMFTEPAFILDEALLQEFQAFERDRKVELLTRVAQDKTVLASNDKFATLLMDMGVEPPTKISPKTGKTAWALAKSDPGMQGLLEHEDEEIRWLAEARIGVKSTINETRTERFLKAGWNGRSVPVYLRYYGAHTGRWSGGDRMNFQNLVRGGELRKSLLAPEGYELVVADSGQIEARVIGWLAGHEELMEIFRRNDALGDAGDFYSDAGSAFFGKKLSKKETPNERQIAKSMCWAGETPVLTERGWVAIVDVRRDDRVWDGVEWVNHQGVAWQGEQEVWESSSVAATPDHGILTGAGWREWHAVLTDPSLFRSALDLAALPSSSGASGSSRPPGAPWAGIPHAGVTAAGRAPSPGTTSRPEEVPSATPAQRPPPAATATGSTSPSWTTTSGAAGSSTSSPHASAGATTPGRSISSITAEEESASARSGGLTGSPSSDTSRPCPAGTSPGSKWIGSTMTTAIAPATSDSSLASRTWETGGLSPSSSNGSTISKRRTQTYDLVSAGPRHRFTILTDAGPLIVHNCLGLGFGMGWAKFSMGLLQGMLGSKPVKFTMAEAEKFGVDVYRFARDGKKAARVEEMPSRLPFQDRLVHCAVTKHFVDLYRSQNAPIVDLWNGMELALAAAEEGSEVAFGPGKCLSTVRHGIRLPNGLCLKYPGLKDDDGFSYLGGKGGKTWVKAYGGSVTENVVQALARIVVAEQMLRVKAAGYKIVTTTHDEIVALTEEGNGQAALNEMLAVMRTPPEWATGLPLNAAGGFGKSYGAVK